MKTRESVSVDICCALYSIVLARNRNLLNKHIALKFLIYQPKCTFAKRLLKLQAFFSEKICISAHTNMPKRLPIPGNVVCFRISSFAYTHIFKTSCWKPFGRN